MSGGAIEVKKGGCRHSSPVCACFKAHEKIVIQKNAESLRPENLFNPMGERLNNCLKWPLLGEMGGLLKVLLIISQRTDGTSHRRFKGLPCHRCKGYSQGNQAGFYEYNRSDMDTVGETLQPVIHHPPAKRD